MHAALSPKPRSIEAGPVSAPAPRLGMAEAARREKLLRVPREPGVAGPAGQRPPAEPRPLPPAHA